MASKLSMDDVRLIERSLGRKPNALEEELFQAMWSEHCSYRHTKPLLRDLPNDNERTLAGPGEGAGAVRLQSGYALVFKLESHNHPSYIDPYEGAATGVGGILRDVFSMGARPLVVAGALTLAPSHQQPSSGKGNGDGDTSPDVLGREVIRGFQAYNETFGVVSGALHVQLDERYAHNPLVNVMAIGVVREEKLVRSKVSSPGLQLIYAGKSADHAGLGGAAFASAARSEHREAEGGVPRAYPDIGKRLFQATDTLIQNGLVQAMQDMGAAGLLSASVEMAAKSGLGVQLFLERVPRENDTVDARAMLLGETQERMLYAVRAEDAPAVLETIASFQLEGAVIGEVIQDDRYVARWEETVLVDVPASFLSGGVPLVDLRLARREKLGGRPADGERSAREGIHAGSGIDRTATEIDRSSLLSRVYEQTLVRIEKRAFPAAWPLDEEAVIFEEKFDEKEERQTVKTSGERGGPAEGEVRQAGPLRFAYALEQSAHTVERDPYRGTAKLVARAALKLALSGSTPLALTNNLNFGDPGDPVVREEIVESVRGMGAAARALNTPVVSGNVSLYNATDDRSIPPNPVIGMVGEIWSENDQPNDQPNDQTKKDVLIALVITLGEPEHYDRFLPLLSTLRDLVGRGVIVRAALWPESDEDPATGLLETLCYWLLDDEAAYTLELEALDRLFRSRIEDDALTAIGVLMRVNGARIVSFEHAMGELPAALASEVQWHTCGSVEREEVPGVTVRLHEMYRTCRREDVLAALERGAGGGKDARSNRRTFAAVFPDASREEALAMMQHALSGLQHRGQDALGWVMVDATGSLATFTGRGQVSQLLTDDIVRSAAGASHSNDETKGRVVAALAVTQQLKKTGGESAHQAPFVETLSTGEQLVWAWNGHLSAELADWWEERAGEPSERLTGLPGAYALVGLWQDTLFLLRDANGVKPLFYGQLDGMVLVASETSVLDHLGASDIEDVSPGALVTFSLKPYYERTSDLSGRSTPSGHRGATPALPNRVPLVSAKDSKLCAFEAIYYSRTDARLFDRSVYALRKGMGEKLADANVPDADVVIGVPDSGTAAAVGYAQKSGYPLEMGLVKNRYVGRTFIQTTQAARERGVRQKLSVIEDVVRHKRVILVDDSIVRGTTARWNVQLLRDAGAREVHLRISAPPVRAACPFDILGTPEEELFVTSILNTAYHINQSKEVHTGSDVLAADALQQLARRLGADSLYFLPLSAFKEVLQNVYCTECFYGRACDSGPSTEQHTPFRTQQRIEQSTQLSSQLDSRQDTQHDTQQDMQLGTQQSTQQSTRLKEAHHARSL